LVIDALWYRAAGSQVVRLVVGGSREAPKSSEPGDFSDGLINRLAWCRLDPVWSNEPQRGLPCSVPTDCDPRSCRVVAGTECRVLQLQLDGLSVALLWIKASATGLQELLDALGMRHATSATSARVGAGKEQPPP
jgi:hypothetical protein